MFLLPKARVFIPAPILPRPKLALPSFNAFKKPLPLPAADPKAPRPYAPAANKAALPSGLLATFLTPLTAFFTRLPSPYSCLGSCIRDIAI